MNRFVALSFLPLAFAVGCLAPAARTPATQTPSTGGDTSDPQGQGDDQAQKSGRSSGRISVVGRETGRKARALKAGNPPKTGDPEDEFDPSDGSGQLSVRAVVPNIGSPGTFVEILGEGFGGQVADNQVHVAGVKWPVRAVYQGRIVAEVPSNAKSGALEVKVKNARGQYSGQFGVMSPDSAFGRPAKELHGLIGLVYPLGGGASALPDFQSLGAPAATVAASTIDLKASLPVGIPTASGALGLNFAVRYVGSLNVVEGAEYELCLTSDDGSALLLEDIPVIDNDGAHKSQKKCELVYLEAGEYGLDLRYFQGASPEMALQLTWAKQGGAAVVIPSSALYRPTDGGAAFGVTR